MGDLRSECCIDSDGSAVSHNQKFKGKINRIKQGNLSLMECHLLFHLYTCAHVCDCMLNEVQGKFFI